MSEKSKSARADISTLFDHIVTGCQQGGRDWEFVRAPPLKVFLFAGVVLRQVALVSALSLHTLPDELDPFEQPETLRFGLFAAASALIQPEFDLLNQTQSNIT